MKIVDYGNRLHNEIVSQFNNSIIIIVVETIVKGELVACCMNAGIVRCASFFITVFFFFTFEHFTDANEICTCKCTYAVSPA